MDADLRIGAPEEAPARHGRPGVLDPEPGSPFTSPRFTDVLRDAGVRVSMGGRDRWTD